MKVSVFLSILFRGFLTEFPLNFYSLLEEKKK